MNRFELNTKSIGGTTFSNPFVNFFTVPNENYGSDDSINLNFDFSDKLLPEGGELTDRSESAGFTFTKGGIIEQLKIHITARHDGSEPLPDQLGWGFFGTELYNGINISLLDKSSASVCSLFDTAIRTDSHLRAISSDYNIQFIPTQLVKEYKFDEYSEKNKEVVEPYYVISADFKLDFSEMFGGGLGIGTGYRICADLHDNFENLIAFHISVSGRYV